MSMTFWRNQVTADRYRAAMPSLACVSLIRADVLPAAPFVVRDAEKSTRCPADRARSHGEPHGFSLGR
jgi:hypothetical protein